VSVREISGDRVAVRVPVENSETVDVVVIVVRVGVSVRKSSSVIVPVALSERDRVAEWPFVTEEVLLADSDGVRVSVGDGGRVIKVIVRVGVLVLVGGSVTVIVFTLDSVLVVVSEYRISGALLTNAFVMVTGATGATLFVDTMEVQRQPICEVEESTETQLLLWSTKLELKVKKRHEREQLDGEGYSSHWDSGAQYAPKAGRHTPLTSVHVAPPSLQLTVSRVAMTYVVHGIETFLVVGPVVQHKNVSRSLRRLIQLPPLPP
jgi:hypothetical protein